MIDNSTYKQEVGLQWLRQAEEEHASVASFARHTLQLMSFGAPSELLKESQRASVDEIKHAKSMTRLIIYKKKKRAGESNEISSSA